MLYVLTRLVLPDFDHSAWRQQYMHLEQSMEALNERARIHTVLGFLRVSARSSTPLRGAWSALEAFSPIV